VLEPYFDQSAQEAKTAVGCLVRDGLLRADGETLILNPLLRKFLITRMQEAHPELLATALDGALEYYLSRERWDEAMSLARTSGISEKAAKVVGASARSLMDAGRLETLDGWIASLPRALRTTPDLSALYAELTLRAGRFRDAATLSEFLASTSSDPQLTVAARLVQGRALHMSSRYAEATLAYRQAAKSDAASEGQCAEAMWGALIAAAAEARKDTFACLREFRSRPDPDADHRLRLAVGEILVREISEDSYLPLWEEFTSAAALLESAQDPLAVSNFRVQHACLALTLAHYEAARDLANQALEYCEAVALQFAEGYCLNARATAELNLGRRSEYEVTRRSLERIVRDSEDPHLRQEFTNLEVREIIRKRGAPSGTHAPRRPHAFAPAVSQSEFLSLNGIALLQQGSFAQALRYGDDASSLCNAASASALARLVMALAHAECVPSKAVLQEIDAARELGCNDAIEVVLTALPRPLERALRAGSPDTSVGSIDLVDHRPPRAPDNAGLTARELEVLELLAEGFTNDEIARHLWIARSTVKVHVRRILKKLGVRDRVQAAIAAREWRA
jgi:DNA-binding NarL/FixJ family response regulator